MGLLKILFSLFIIFFPIAELGRFQLGNGVSFSLNDVLLSLVIFYWFWFSVRKGTFLDSGFLKKSLLLFSLIGALALVINFGSLSLENFAVSFLYLVRFVSYALLYFIVKDFDPKFKKTVTYLMLLSGSIVVLVGYVQYFFYPSLRNLYYLGWDEHLYRMFSSFFDPNFAGAFFVLFLLFLSLFVNKFYENKNYVKFSFVVIMSILTFLAVYLTYSRSALVMLMVGIITYLFLINKKKFILLGILIMILFVFLSPKSFQTEGTNLFRTVSSEARIASANQGFNIFIKNPVLGVGFDAYRYALNRYEGLNSKYWLVTHSGGGTDNSFIFVLATTGILGFIAYIYFLYKMVKLGFSNIKKNKYFSAIFICSVLTISIDSLFINSLFYVFIMEWLFLLAGLIENK
jgi:O-antigen ligase